MFSVFGNVILFVYTDSCNISVENVSELLNTGDMFFLPGIGLFFLAGMRYECMTGTLGNVKSAESFNFPRVIPESFLLLEYLSQIKTKFENIFSRSSGADEVLILEKNETQKISCNSLLKHFLNSQRLMC